MLRVKNFIARISRMGVIIPEKDTISKINTENLKPSHQQQILLLLCIYKYCKHITHSTFFCKIPIELIKYICSLIQQIQKPTKLERYNGLKFYYYNKERVIISMSKHKCRNFILFNIFSGKMETIHKTCINSKSRKILSFRTVLNFPFDCKQFVANIQLPIVGVTRHYIYVYDNFIENIVCYNTKTKSKTLIKLPNYIKLKADYKTSFYKTFFNVGNHLFFYLELGHFTGDTIYYESDIFCYKIVEAKLKLIDRGSMTLTRIWDNYSTSEQLPNLTQRLIKSSYFSQIMQLNENQVWTTQSK